MRIQSINSETKGFIPDLNKTRCFALQLIAGLICFWPIISHGQNQPSTKYILGAHLSATSLYNFETRGALDILVGRTLTCDVTREKERIFLSCGIFTSNYNCQLKNDVITYSYIDGGYEPNSSHYRGYRWKYQGSIFSSGLRASMNFRVSKSHRKIQTKIGLTGLIEHVIYRKITSDSYLKYTRDSYSSYNPWTQQVETSTQLEEEYFRASEVMGLHTFHPGTSMECFLRLSTSHLRKNEFGLELKWTRHFTGFMGSIDGYRFRNTLSIGLIWSFRTKASTS